MVGWWGDFWNQFGVIKPISNVTVYNFLLSIILNYTFAFLSLKRKVFGWVYTNGCDFIKSVHCWGVKNIRIRGVFGIPWKSLCRPLEELKNSAFNPNSFLPGKRACQRLTVHVELLEHAINREYFYRTYQPWKWKQMQKLSHERYTPGTQRLMPSPYNLCIFSRVTASLPTPVFYSK